VGWFDDFNDGSVTDGNPVTWEQNLFGFFPGVYDASSGDYALSNHGSGNNNQLVTWVDGVSFTDSYIRAQGVVLPGSQPNEVGGNLALLGRLDPNTVSAYVLYIDDGGQLGLQIALGGALSDLAPAVNLGDINAASDVIIELDVIGNELSGYAWRPGDLKPASPQIFAIDNTFPSGKAGIAYDEDDDNTTGLFRFAAAQDTPFVDMLAGDYNHNGTVDAADYVAWRDGLAGGVFTPQDYNTWRANFGSKLEAGGSAGASASVPEPAGLLLIFFAIGGGVSFARARQR
jgi:hypothetical protein